MGRLGRRLLEQVEQLITTPQASQFIYSQLSLQTPAQPSQLMEYQTMLVLRLSVHQALVDS
jgi:hypothetical protein